MKPYKSISCDFYDQLEIFAMRGTIVEIVHSDETGRRITLRGRIQTILQEKGAEYLLMEDGQRIRLDFLIAVNGPDAGLYC
ncbi:MAG: modulator protein [Calditrichaeota bacterium]|nr:MAG: modulator protein [Calditrichota bacterium]